MKYIIFIDVVGYTEALDKEREKTKKLLKDYRHLISGKIETISGQIIQSSGDGYYIQFNGSERPMDVINCIISIIESISEFKNYLAIRTGIHYADIEEGTEYNIDINFAQRLEANALPNQINISEIIYSFIKDQVNELKITKDERELKGLGKRIFYRINISNNNTEYTNQKIESTFPDGIKISNNLYTIIAFKSKNKSMFEAKYNNGDIFYTEMSNNGNILTKIDSNETYTLILPPNEDLIEKNEKIISTKKIVSLYYKWDAKIHIEYNMNNEIEEIQFDHVKISISRNEKKVNIGYIFQ
jgi:hypothetical protein